MKKNIFISTGGSGGHVGPAKVLCEHLIKEANLTISTDKRGLKYFEKDSYQLEIINTPKLNKIFFYPVSLFKVLFLSLKSFFLLKKTNIDIVISTGGYMSLPIVLAARFLKIKIYLIEPNQVIGRANKYFLSFCEKIFCYSDYIKNFPKKYDQKITTIYPLISKKIYNFRRQKKTPKKFTILVVGGSQGANIFDKDLRNIIVNISKTNSLKVIQQTKERDILSLKEFYSKNFVENEIFNFDKNLFQMIDKSDLCITRSGASTLAELSFMNTPFVAVPLPTSKDDHQLENAKFYKENNCCWLIEQKNFEEKIEELLKKILNGKSDYLKKKENLKKINYQNNWTNINQKIIKIINEN